MRFIGGLRPAILTRFRRCRTNKLCPGTSCAGTADCIPILRICKSSTGIITDAFNVHRTLSFMNNAVFRHYLIRNTPDAGALPGTRNGCTFRRINFAAACNQSIVRIDKTAYSAAPSPALSTYGRLAGTTPPASFVANPGITSIIAGAVIKHI